MIEIRDMHWWDIEAVHELEQQLFPVDCWSVEQFWSELAQPTRRYLVACEGEQILGYAGLFVLPPDSDVQTIGVAPAAQGSGLGALLLSALIHIAETSGASQLMLEVRADNAPAIRLYARHGFEPISSRRDYYEHGVDALIMRLRPVRVHT